MSCVGVRMQVCQSKSLGPSFTEEEEEEEKEEVMAEMMRMVGKVKATSPHMKRARLEEDDDECGF